MDIQTNEKHKDRQLCMPHLVPKDMELITRSHSRVPPGTWICPWETVDPSIDVPPQQWKTSQSPLFYLFIEYLEKIGWTNDANNDKLHVRACNDA